MLLQLLRGTHAINLATPSSFLLQNRSVTSRISIPTPPKKPKLSAYLGFVTLEREKLLKNHPNLQATEVIKTLAAQWRTLDAETKERYWQITRENHERRLESYQKEHQSFLDSLSPQQLQELDYKEARKKILKIKKKAQGIESSLGKPSRPPNAFCLFLRDFSASDPATKFRLAEGLRRWEALPEERKLEYRELYQKKLGEYTISKEEYVQRKREDAEASEKLKKLKQKAASIKAKKPSADNE